MVCKLKFSKSTVLGLSAALTLLGCVGKQTSDYRSSQSGDEAAGADGHPGPIEDPAFAIYFPDGCKQPSSNSWEWINSFQIESVETDASGQPVLSYGNGIYGSDANGKNAKTHNIIHVGDTLKPNAQYNFKVEIGNSYSEYVRLWLDSNGDATISDDELLWTTAAICTGGTECKRAGVVEGTFTTPSLPADASANLFDADLRVAIKYMSPTPEACVSSNWSYGEVEDYTFTMGEPFEDLAIVPMKTEKHETFPRASYQLRPEIVREHAVSTELPHFVVANYDFGEIDARSAAFYGVGTKDVLTTTYADVNYTAFTEFLPAPVLIEAVKEACLEIGFANSGECMDAFIAKTGAILYSRGDDPTHVYDPDDNRDTEIMAVLDSMYGVSKAMKASKTVDDVTIYNKFYSLGCQSCHMSAKVEIDNSGKSWLVVDPKGNNSASDFRDVNLDISSLWNIAMAKLDNPSDEFWSRDPRMKSYGMMADYVRQQQQAHGHEFNATRGQLEKIGYELDAQRLVDSGYLLAYATIASKECMQTSDPYRSGSSFFMHKLQHNLNRNDCLDLPGNKARVFDSYYLTHATRAAPFETFLPGGARFNIARTITQFDFLRLPLRAQRPQSQRQSVDRNSLDFAFAFNYVNTRRSDYSQSTDANLSLIQTSYLHAATALQMPVPSQSELAGSALVGKWGMSYPDIPTYHLYEPWYKPDQNSMDNAHGLGASGAYHETRTGNGEKTLGSEFAPTLSQADATAAWQYVDQNCVSCHESSAFPAPTDCGQEFCQLAMFTKEGAGFSMTSPSSDYVNSIAKSIDNLPATFDIAEANLNRRYRRHLELNTEIVHEPARMPLVRNRALLKHGCLSWYDSLTNNCPNQWAVMTGISDGTGTTRGILATSGDQQSLLDQGFRPRKTGFKHVAYVRPSSSQLASSVAKYLTAMERGTLNVGGAYHVQFGYESDASSSCINCISTAPDSERTCATFGTNPAHPLDVNNDGWLNNADIDFWDDNYHHSPHTTITSGECPAPLYLDANGDGELTSRDHHHLSVQVWAACGGASSCQAPAYSFVKQTISNDPTDVICSKIAHNASLPGDVNNNGYVSALDSLVIVNGLNTYPMYPDDYFERKPQGSTCTQPSKFYDVNNDGAVNVLDAYIVVNAIERESYTPDTEFYAEHSKEIELPIGQLDLNSEVFGQIKESYTTLTFKLHGSTTDADDFIFTLTNPDGDSMQLCSRYACGPSQGKLFDLNFDVSSLITSQPGLWKLAVTRWFHNDGMTIHSWTLEASNSAFVQTVPRPNNLRLVSRTPDLITVAWDDNSSSESGFTLQRSSNGYSFYDVAITNSNIESHGDGYSISGYDDKTFYYRVKAHGTYESEYSETIKVDP